MLSTAEETDGGSSSGKEGENETGITGESSICFLILQVPFSFFFFNLT